MLYLGHEERMKTNRADSNKEDSIVIPLITNSRSKNITKRVSSYSIPLRHDKNNGSRSKPHKLQDPRKSRKNSISGMIHHE